MLKVIRQAAVHIVRYLRRKNTKITGFNPLIATKGAESAISLFEALGFEKRHTKEGVGEDNATDVRMQDANGFHVDVARVESLEKDMATMRMNVHDFDEAYAFLKARGFKNARGEDHAIESKYARSCLMVAPSGFTIQLTRHIRNHD